MAEVTFGEWLKRQRGARGLTQAQLAQRLGCSAIALRKIEAEERRPSEQIVARLAEVFNIVPAERPAFLKFARGDWRSAPTPIDDEAPWHTARTSPRSNLPASTTSLIGREGDIAALHGYLAQADVRLVTLIGPPGIGKTRLSMAVARAALTDFTNGVFFVALAPLDQPDLVAPAIVQVLDLVEAQRRSIRERLTDGIGDKRMLLVLDNVEHLIEDTALLVSDLLSVCPQLKILTTSREALRAPGEWLYPVPSLAIPTTTQVQSLDLEETARYAALTLFAERARAVRPDFRVNVDNLPAVAAICARLDGLPLAIELIAARLRSMSPSALLARLSAPFVLSADGMRALSARQKTLQGAIGWSYDMLSAEEQCLFARLAVFAGGFTLDAAEAVFSRTITDKSISDLIASLLDKSLLQRAPDERGEPRFAMLVTIQQFALTHLRRSNEDTEVRNWHLAYFLDLAEKADKEIHGPDQIEWMDRLEIEHDNLRAALDWSLASQQIESHLRLFGALTWFRRVRSFLDEARTGFDKIRTEPAVVNHPAAYAKVLNGMGRWAWLLGDYDDAQESFEKSRELWQKLGGDGQRGLAEAIDFLGAVALWAEANNQQAQDFFEQAVELYRACGDQWGLAEGLFHLGITAAHRNEHTLAFSLFEQSLDLFRQLGDVWGIARVSQNLGELFLKQGKYENARVYFEQHLRLDEGLHFQEGMTVALSNLGDLYRHQFDYDQAEQFYEKDLAISREYSLKVGQAGAFNGLGLVALGRRDYLLAARYFKDAYNIRHTMHKIWSAIDFLHLFAAVAAGLNQFERAARLHGAAQALFNRFDLPDISYDRVESDTLIQIAREQLGEAAFEALTAEGRALSLEQAIELALSENESHPRPTPR